MLQIVVAATPHELTLLKDIDEYTAVVIDALRATSTITTALANGCTRIWPVTTVSEAEALKKTMPQALLAGERGGAKLSGYDLGNSPQEYAPSIISGREVIFTTSNGTPTLVACEQASPVYAASFLNRRAISVRAKQAHKNILIACAGHHGKLAAEDLACAGAIIAELMSQGAEYSLTDGAVTALALFNAWQDNLTALLSATYSGKNINHLGYGSDIAYCAQLDIMEIVPEYKDKQIRRETF